MPLLALLLLAPTLLHGRPFVFWDTAQYYHYGAKLSDFVVKKLSTAPKTPTESTGTSNPERPPEAEGGGHGITFYGARSPFYSIWLYALAQTLGIWAVPFTQAAAVAWLIWRTAAHALTTRRFEWAASAAALATFGAGAWFTIGFVMPDVYAAVALASVALLFAYGDHMSIVERLGLAVLLAASATFHSTHLGVAIAVSLAGVLVARIPGFWKGSFPRQAMLATVSALALAVALQLAFDAAARRGLGTSPKRPPFLMARVIADGPGRLYLDNFCQQGNAFTVCAYRDRSFKTADDFLWSGLPKVGVFTTVPLKERLSLIDEELRFVAAVARHYPLSVLRAAVANAIEQFGLISPTEAWIDPGASFTDPSFRQMNLFEVASFLNSCVDRLGSCVPTVPERLVFAIVVITVLLAFGIIAIHVVTAHQSDPIGDRREDDLHRRAVIFALLIVFGLIVNAALCGAVSGPHQRYQARLVWLAVVAAAFLEAVRPIVISRLLPRQWGSA